MSWSITSLGKAADVAAEVAAMDYVPQPIKDLIALIAKEYTAPNEGLSVVSSGHIGSGPGSYNNVELKITPIHIAPSAPNVDTAVSVPPLPNDLTRKTGKVSL